MFRIYWFIYQSFDILKQYWNEVYTGKPIILFSDS